MQPSTPTPHAPRRSVRWSTLLPIALAAVALAVVAYQRIEIGRLRAATPPVIRAGADPSAADLARRNQELEARMAFLATARSTPPQPAAPAPLVAALPLAGDGGVASAPAAPPAAAAPADPMGIRAHLQEMIAERKSRSLGTPEQRQRWIQGFATAQRLTPDQAARLGQIFDSEMARRQEVLQQARDGMRTREDALGEARRLQTESVAAARAVLDDDAYRQYLGRRAMSGLALR